MLLISGCSHSSDKNKFSPKPGGYYYHLISFQVKRTSVSGRRLCTCWYDLFQSKDSIFWDSENNLNEDLFLQSDPSDKADPLRRCISASTIGDSGCMLIKKELFFGNWFQSRKIPWFCATDSVVKINFRIKAVIGKTEYAGLQSDLEIREDEKIRSFFGPEVEEALHARDSLGIYWVSKFPEGYGTVKNGDEIEIAYEAQYLNGRPFDNVPHFRFIVGHPGQVLEGLNYVIRRLGEGETAKIILPSRSAFGAKRQQQRQRSSLHSFAV